jgi:hypothetical protein
MAKYRHSFPAAGEQSPQFADQFDMYLYQSQVGQYADLYQSHASQYEYLYSSRVSQYEYMNQF